MSVFVLTATFGDGAYDVVTMGVFSSQSEAENASRRLVGIHPDVLEVRLDAPLDRPLHEGPLTRRGHMALRWDE